METGGSSSSGGSPYLHLRHVKPEPQDTPVSARTRRSGARISDNASPTGRFVLVEPKPEPGLPAEYEDIARRGFFDEDALRPPNRVNWDETGAAHIYSADLPGVKKEEIRVEIEDGRYLVIRTELDAGDAEVHGRRGSFARKFRLPGMVNTDGITTDYARGVLTVTVPRMHTRAQPVVNLIGLGPACDPVARAA
ncbi:18.8 kDa class V heat shock protein-like [Triticum urartu]|nr:18.8 kDa class V heat shock protein-like [Triticum urartu]